MRQRKPSRVGRGPSIRRGMMAEGLMRRRGSVPVVRTRERRGRAVVEVRLGAVQGLVDGVLGHGVAGQGVDVGVRRVVDGVGRVGQHVRRQGRRGGAVAVAVVTMGCTKGDSR